MSRLPKQLSTKTGEAHIATGAPLEKSWMALIVHHPAQIELVRQGALMIQPRIGRPAAAIVPGFTQLGLGSSHHLAVAIEAGQPKRHGGLGLHGTQLLHQLVALQCYVVLEIDGSGIEISGGLKQGDRDGAGTLEYLPGHRASALALWQGAVAGRYRNKPGLAVKRQLHGTKQTAAAQQQAHDTRAQMSWIVKPVRA